ncbi:hypothetical protein J15TS10_24240 [Paenibacillus woosongensis]|uniref:Uncharacterized protein n=1 Tax=Paenibacillus woosongensis TaxID=307580 RepID=A0ABQ4MRI0_9BACL|nr:hypothetical protein J15TS10_24240 [Paenibacillus woosongensis]
MVIVMFRSNLSGKVSITVHETNSATISSPGNVQIQGGDVKLEAGKGLSLQAGTALYLKGGASSMVLDGETDLKAPVIEQEGTIKAPVFVTDLPPVPEPELISVQEYEAAQSSAASHTSSGSGNSPTAKITSPAAEAAANSMLAIESKFVGSIPAMAGILIGALGGPVNKAVGVALLATAGVPVRSDGKARDVPANNPFHPLKQLAGLLLQGLIDQRMYEEERQAYYTQWILGKMVTSARQVSHSNSKLELIYHLLNESNNIYQAYHQVPEDVRRRWEPPRYFPEEYVDTHRLTLEVQTELNWSDELTKDVAQRIAKKQDYNLIVKEMKRKYGVDVLGGVAIIYTCYNAERDGVTLNELFWGNPIDVPTVKGGGFIGPSLGLKKPGLNNMNTEMPKETPKPPNQPNTSNKNPVFGADWNEFLQSKYGKNAVEWVSKGREELRTKVKTNVEQSAAVREASNFDVHLKKEKEILERIKNKGTGNTIGNFAGKINAENIPNMSKQEILDSLPKDWKYTENNGFVHIRDANGNVRMKIDPPDKVTKYDHVHLFDESGNPIDVNLNVVDRKSPDAHIPYKK